MFHIFKILYKKIENSSLGKLNVKDISNDDIQKFLNDNKNYSNSYIKKLYEQLNQAFNFAIKNKYILQNPMDDVIKPKSTKEDKEVRALTIEEQQSLSNYLLNCTINEETYKNVFLIQMYLGLRIGETLALNINDIDIEKQIINVNKTLTLGKDNEVIMGDTTKTYASKRTIPIPDFLIPSIKEQLEIAKENKDNMNITDYMVNAGIKRKITITNIFRETNTEIRKNRKINGFNNGKYKKIHKGIKYKNVQNRNKGNRYNKFNKRNTGIAKDVKNTSKIKIYC